MELTGQVFHQKRNVMHISTSNFQKDKIESKSSRGQKINTGSTKMKLHICTAVIGTSHMTNQICFVQISINRSIYICNLIKIWSGLSSSEER